MRLPDFSYMCMSLILKQLECSVKRREEVKDDSFCQAQAQPKTELDLFLVDCEYSICLLASKV